MTNMKLVRLHKGLKQKEVARMLGVSAQYLGQVENMKNNITQELLIKLAKIYGVSVRDLQ